MKPTQELRNLNRSALIQLAAMPLEDRVTALHVWRQRYGTGWLTIIKEEEEAHEYNTKD